MHSYASQLFMRFYLHNKNIELNWIEKGGTNASVKTSAKLVLSKNYPYTKLHAHTHLIHSHGSAPLILWGKDSNTVECWSTQWLYWSVLARVGNVPHMPQNAAQRHDFALYLRYTVSHWILTEYVFMIHCITLNTHWVLIYDTLYHIEYLLSTYWILIEYLLNTYWTFIA